ncbi:MAG: 3-deoxy-manno-octulosonate cytidylyltransferase [Desulfococcaceae bacterium]|nr:3-deoxy-manno-octulosonate cytidylyltransferase [Desulfococcaceae bacterium]
MKIVVIIPSRYGSTRFTAKPLALIAGKPMIQRVYEAAKQAENITDVVVATDDRRIMDAVEAFGGRALMTSPENRSGTDRAGDAARQMGLAGDDIIINVQGDQPMLDPRCLDEVIRPFFSDPGLHMSTLAYKIVNPDEISNPKEVKVVFDAQGFALYFSRSPIPFCREPGQESDTYRHLGIYAYTLNFLDIFRRLPLGKLEDTEKLEQLRALEYGYQIKVLVTACDSPEVDLPEDIDRIETLLQSRRK